MSAVLAIAEPRRIKATHRWRRKVTAGRFVQRYYDPQVGGFLSGDPAAVNTNTAANFCRYCYASNNPYKFTDPDGRNGVTFVGGLLYESGQYLAGNGFDSSHLGSALRDGYDGQGSGKLGAAIDDATTFIPIGSLEKAGSKVVGEGGHAVYQALSAEGKVIYVGITNDLKRRAPEHLRSARGLVIEGIEALQDLSRADAKAVEQVLIETHGLAKQGGNLLNHINSIAKKNPIYQSAIARGKEILEKLP